MSTRVTYDPGNFSTACMDSVISDLVSARRLDYVRKYVLNYSPFDITIKVVASIVKKIDLGEHVFSVVDAVQDSISLTTVLDGVLVNVWVGNSNVIFEAFSACADESEPLLAKIALIKSEIIVHSPTVDDLDQNVSFYFFESGRASRIIKSVRCHDFNSISHNYPRVMRSDLEYAFDLKNPWDLGKIMLWHGFPGTGKTNAIRALIYTWTKKLGTMCSVIQDPENFFNNVNYIHAVIFRSEENEDYIVNGDPSKRSGSHLIILEDSADYILQSSRKNLNHAMSKLLNMSDGLLSQSANLVFLITTNEVVKDIDPAITRPGRCLQNLEFPKFESASDIADFFRLHGKPDYVLSDRDTPVSLAELYQKLNHAKHEVFA